MTSYFLKLSHLQDNADTSQSKDLILGEMYSDVFRFTIIFVIVLFVAKMFSRFQTTQDAQEETTLRMNALVTESFPRTHSDIVKNIAELKEESKTLSATAHQTSEIAHALIQFAEIGKNLHWLERTLDWQNESVRKVVPGLMLGISNDLRDFVKKVVEKANPADSMQTPDDVLPLAAFLCLFDEYLKTEMRGVFKPHCLEFKTTFTHYALTVKRLVEVFDNLDLCATDKCDGYAFYTALCKPLRSFLNYDFTVNGDLIGPTDRQWLDFLLFNACFIKEKGIKYTRHFLCADKNLKEGIQNPLAKESLPETHAEVSEDMRTLRVLCSPGENCK